MTCLLFLEYVNLKFRPVLNLRNPRTCRIKTSDRNNAMTSARLESVLPLAREIARNSSDIRWIEKSLEPEVAD